MKEKVPLIGNDIVDLNHKDTIQPSSRFIQRVFDPSEIKIISSTLNVWLAWGAKETLYKALRRYQRDLVFAHKKFIVQSLDVSRKSGTVSYEGITQEFSFETADEHVHVFMKISKPDKTCVKKISHKESHREKARELAIETFASAANVSAENLSIQRNDFRSPPQLFLKEEPLPVLFSLSHHGHFVACAMHVDDL